MTTESSQQMNRDIIPIITVSSAAYLKYALVMIWSVMQCGDREKRYAFYIFHDELTAEHQAWLKTQLRSWDNCDLSFLDIRELEKVFSPKTGDWEGKSACFSLFSVDFLQQYDKALALDVDLIVRRDVAALYDTELGDALLGAVCDLDFIGQWRKGNKKYHHYYRCSVPLSNPSTYIQSGVLVLNLSGLRQRFPPGFFIQIAAKAKYQYDDQDIWNQYCAGCIKRIDYRWNVLHDNNRYRVRYVIDLAPKAEVEQYRRSRQSPFIIHYAGDQKPWNDVGCDLGEAFWSVANQTPVADELPSPAAKQRLPKWLQPIWLIRHECSRIYSKLYIKMWRR